MDPTKNGLILASEEFCLLPSWISINALSNDQIQQSGQDSPKDSFPRTAATRGMAALSRSASSEFRSCSAGHVQDSSGWDLSRVHLKVL